MPRNISFFLTTEQFLDGSKDVTRRDGWRDLKAGDVLCAVRKAQGIKKGEKIEKLGMIRIVSARQERLGMITVQEVRREGFPGMLPSEFIDFFCRSHKTVTADTFITRIEFERIS